MAARFQMLAGVHHQGSPLKGTLKSFHGPKRNAPVDSGDVFEAKTEKEASFCRKYPDKFKELAPTPVQRFNEVPPESDSIIVDVEALDSMGVPELKILAHNIGVNLKGLRSKADLIKAVKEACGEGTEEQPTTTDDNA